MKFCIMHPCHSVYLSIHHSLNSSLYSSSSYTLFGELNSSNFKWIYRNDKVSSENGIGFNNGNPVTNSSAGCWVTVAINPNVKF